MEEYDFLLALPPPYVAAAASKMKARQAVNEKKTCGALKPAQTTTRPASRHTSTVTREGEHPWYGPCHRMVEQYQRLVGFPRLQFHVPDADGVHTHQHSSAVQRMQLPKVPGIIFTKRYYSYYVPLCPETQGSPGY